MGADISSPPSPGSLGVPPNSPIAIWTSLSLLHCKKMVTYRAGVNIKRKALDLYYRKDEPGINGGLFRPASNDVCHSPVCISDPWRRADFSNSKNPSTPPPNRTTFISKA